MITLQNERLRVCLAERGAEIVSVQNADGYEFIWQADPAFWGKHCPLLFPVCGRLLHFTHVYEGKEYKMGNHGFAQRKILPPGSFPARRRNLPCTKTKRRFPSTPSALR